MAAHSGIFWRLTVRRVVAKLPDLMAVMTGRPIHHQAHHQRGGLRQEDGRESFLTFENGVGDVAITYENEVYAGLQAGGDFETVYPTSTPLIENPIALVDTYVDKHGTRRSC